MVPTREKETKTKKVRKKGERRSSIAFDKTHLSIGLKKKVPKDQNTPEGEGVTTGNLNAGPPRRKKRTL